jgi:hypothetical protein
MTLIIVLAVLLVGCASPVVLRNPETGEMAQCQSDSMAFGTIGQTYSNEQCAEAYERAGWERLTD